MNPIQVVLLFFVIASGLALLLLFMFSSPEEDALFSGKTNQGTPGTFDAAKNKIIAYIAITFVVSVIAINAINTRSKKVNFVFDKNDLSQKTKNTNDLTGKNDQNDKDY